MEKSKRAGKYMPREISVISIWKILDFLKLPIVRKRFQRVS